MDLIEHYSLNHFGLMTSLLAMMNTHGKDDVDYILARYFLQHFAELGKLNIYEVADACFVSRSSIRRFCQAIGYENFSGLKAEEHEWALHYTAFTNYVNRPNFPAYLHNALNDMSQEINRLAELQNLDSLVEHIHDSREIYMLTADCSSMAARELQQQMVVMGRLVTLITDSDPSAEKLNDVGPADILITTSATGNYAMAINNMVRQLDTYKVLITLNRDKRFYSSYDYIFYLSEKHKVNPELQYKQRNVYTRYSINYFSDLLYSRYVRRYLSEITALPENKAQNQGSIYEP